MPGIPRFLSKDWEELVATVPDDLDISAKEHGALRRRRKIKSAADLLRIILIYAILLSLRMTALWAVGLKVVDVSRQDIQQRVLNSTPWLRHLMSVLLNSLLDVPLDGEDTIKRVVLRDASVISRPGSPGTEWRVHLSWCPFNLQPAQVTVTDVRTGEGLDDAGLQAGDLVVADRAHGIWRAIKVALQAMTFFIIRLTWSNLPLLTPNGQPFNLIAWLRSIPESTEHTEVTVIAADDSEKRSLRLVAGRLPPDKAQEAREKVRRQARKEKRPVNPNTLLAASFCILITNLPAATWSALFVLAFYRVRWQVEWCFRRWKSLCHLDQLPSYPAKIAEPVLLAKVIIILLMQKHLGSLPWADWWVAEEPPIVVSPVLQMIYGHLCEIICPSAVAFQLLQDPTPFLRHLRSSRRKRPLQLTVVTHCFAALLPGFAPCPSPG